AAGSSALLGIGGEADAGEDLPALGEVPVAEAEGGDARVGRPRAAAQHAVLRAEEDLGVLAIRVGDEAWVAVEPGGGPLPDLPDALEVPVGPGRRLLPLSFGGEPCSARASEGVGLEPGDVAHRSVRVSRLCVRTAADVVVLLPGPALVAPPLAAPVAAALGE